MAKKKQDDPSTWDRSLFPKKIKKDGKIIITDGYIGTTKVNIVSQPKEAVNNVNAFFARKWQEKQLENEKKRRLNEC